MKVLSVREPWASLIIYGIPHEPYRTIGGPDVRAGRHFKNVENRTWAPYPSLREQRIGIHASARLDPLEVNDAFRFIREQFRYQGATLSILDSWQREIFEQASARCGHILGTVTFVEALSPDGSGYAWHVDGQFGWLLRKPIALQQPIRARGSLGLWNFNLEGSVSTCQG